MKRFLSSVFVGASILICISPIFSPIAIATTATTWVCTGCSCDCSSGLVHATGIPAPFPGGRTTGDPEAVCTASCRGSNPTCAAGFDASHTVGCFIEGVDVPSAPASTANSSSNAPDSNSVPVFRTPASFNYANPLGTTNITTIINRIVRTALGFVGALFLAMFIYGGTLWMIAAGDEKKVISAKSTLKNSIMGMVVISLSYVIINILFEFATQVRGA